MVSTVTPPLARAKHSKLLALTAPAVVVLLTACGLMAHHYWPFTESAVRAQLASAASAKVSMGQFRTKYFPPGCVAENVTFQRENSAQPLITIQRVTITSNLRGLLRHHVSEFKAEGVHLILGRSDLTRKGKAEQQTTVDKLIAHDAILEITQKSHESPLRFVFHKFEIEDTGPSSPTKFAAEFENPLPHGMIRTSGQFGPWNSAHPEETPVSGKYSLEHADLGVFHAVSGLISSKGDFTGTFKAMHVGASTTTPKLVVTRTQHGLPVETRVSASVNAITGDVVLGRVQAQFGKDELDIHGSVARIPGGKRAAILDIHCERGRIEDTFYPFIHAPRSPLTGNVVFQMHVAIPSGPERFLKKLELSSDFRIPDAVFTNPKTESEMSKISQKHGQEQTDNQTLSDFQGRVQVNHGVAHFVELSVRDQGAAALFQGNYNLIDERVDLHGKLKTEVSLTKTTHGIKAAFARVLEPFFKKAPHVNVVPVKIGGTYAHPSFGLDVNSPAKDSNM